jgi:anaerobic selenocysteine-containing dehydrogenase
VTFHASTCPYCACGCGLILEARDGRLVGAHPRAGHEVTRGSLCMRGWNSTGATHHPDRLRTALIRREASLVPVPPSEGLQEAARMLAAASGPATLVAVSPSCASEDAAAALRLARLLGARVGSPDPSGVGVARRALRRVFGRDRSTLSLEDLAGADLVWLFGTDLDVFPQVASRVVLARRRGAKIVSFDVMASGTGVPGPGGIPGQRRAGDSVVTVPPEAFGLLPLALQRAVFETGRVSDEARDTLGFSRLASSWMPGRARSLPPHPWMTRDDARLLVNGFLAARNPAVLIGERWLMSRHAEESTLQLLQAAALLGAGDRILVVAGEVNSWGVPAAEDSVMVDLLDPRRPVDLEALLVVEDDLPARAPYRGLLADKLAAIPSVLVIDRFRSGLLEHAHAVLPSCAFGEVGGSVTNLAGTQQELVCAVEPPGDARPAREWIEGIIGCVDALGGFAGRRAAADVGALAGVPAWRPALTEAVLPEPLEWPGDFAARLLFRRIPFDWATGALSGRELLLARERAHDTLFVSPEDLQQAGVRTGQALKVTTPTAEAVMPVREDPRLPPGTLMAALASTSPARVLRGFFPDTDRLGYGIQPVPARIERT